MKFRLTRKERRRLSGFMEETKDKLEYARAAALLMRWRGRKAKEVAKELNVCVGTVFKWEHEYREKGIDGLRTGKITGRPAKKRPAARKAIPKILKEDPSAFGFLKGRWVVRDISKALKEEGVEISPTQVHGILKELGLSYKRPKLDVKSDDPNYYRKKKEIGSYKKAAPALEKGGSS